MLDIVRTYPLSPFLCAPYGPGTASLGFSRAMGRGQGKRAAEAGGRGMCIGNGGGRGPCLVRKIYHFEEPDRSAKKMNGKGF